MSKTESNDEPDEEQNDGACYEVRFREPAGYGGKWNNRRTYVTCDTVKMTGKVVHFISDGADELAVNQDHLINYERKW